jgi:bifunctional DNase/RNase
MESMIEAEIWTIARTDQGNAVLLRPLGSDVSVPIFIGQFEAQAILIGYGDIVIPRPLTHDLLLNVIHHLGLELIRVEVHDLQEGTFYSRLILSGKLYPEKKPLVLDARPSDAFALAVRCKCPVFVSDRVVKEAGVSVDLVIDAADGVFEDGAGEAPPIKPKNPEKVSRQEALQGELEQAVAAENYERAAEIRDILALLKKKGGKNEPEA